MTSLIKVVEHDLALALPEIGRFDAIVSSFCIHHLNDARKQGLYCEIFEALEAGGIFCNLEHVTSPTPDLHAAFYAATQTPLKQEDSSNQCASVELQLEWLRRIKTDVSLLPNQKFTLKTELVRGSIKQAGPLIKKQ
jgi:tRNA (cmo5U34)-methyltransferase